MQGGSTITQQTAKNVFTREKRGYFSKLKELFQGLILEHFYTKEEILEMYVNQFEVTGFGKGLRIASEYFFDKDVEDLNLVEAAFIAGMVKGPYKYNPFIKNTDEKKKKAIEYANIRKNYVLKNMLKQSLITNDEYIEARDLDVPFKEGKVTYRLNVLLDYIREQLESDYFKEILHDEGVDNIATSGIKIHTSINKVIQEKALKSIRKTLPLLDTKLSGMNHGLFKERYINKVGAYYTTHKSGLPFFVQINKISIKENKPEISVSWGNNMAGIVDNDELNDVVNAWAIWKYGYNIKHDFNYLNEFVKLFNEGDMIPVILHETDDNKVCLAPIPELEGGVIIIKDGMIKAMVGGYFNRHFNRAVNAKRQLGSIFKPIVYAAALQLKWNNLDELSNYRDLYTFENTPYLPKPDHEPKTDKVSMAWAGVKSENLATVWLLYHLTDRLNVSEFKQIVELMGLNRGKKENYRDYIVRIRDKHGVIVNTKAIRNAAFTMARKTIESDLIFEDNLYALDNINRLHFNIDRRKIDSKNNSVASILRYDYQRLLKLNLRMLEDLKDINLVFTLFADDPGAIEGRLQNGLSRLYILKSGEDIERIIYTDNPTNINGRDFYQAGINDLIAQKENFQLDDIWIDDLVPSGTLNNLKSDADKHYKELTSLPRYDIQVLSQIRDFKTLVSLLYVKELAKNIGIGSSWLDPVLSFPLGPNSISILEGALAYQSIMSGDISPLPGTELKNSMVPIITKITDRDDDVIWEYRPESKTVLSKKVSASIKEILRMVVKHGTGRSAKDAIRMTLNFENGKMELPVPCFGKTGTANRYTNSSFVGFVPGVDRLTGEFDINDGYVIAAYVGYDNNFPMKGKSFSITGASGALPIWIDSTKGIVDSDEYKKGVNVADLAFFSQSSSMSSDMDMIPYKVSVIDGLPVNNNIIDFPIEELTDIFVFMQEEDQIPTWYREFSPLKGINNEQNE